MKKLGIVDKVLVGKAVPYTRGSVSGINKQVVTEPQQTTELGFTHDEQGDKRVHGGIEKAIHIYPSEHYPLWRSDIGDKPILQSVGAFGENLSSIGITEDNVCLNDTVRIGSTLLQVSQGRMPCWKLNDRFSQDDMAMRVQNALRTGWYYRVLEPGHIAAGDEIILCDRPYPDWPVSRIMGLVFQGCLDKAQLQPMLDLPLVESWRKLVQRRIDNQVLENWQPRVQGPTT